MCLQHGGKRRARDASSAGGVGTSVLPGAGWWVLEGTSQGDEVDASLYVNVLRKGIAREFEVE